MFLSRIPKPAGTVALTVLATMLLAVTPSFADLVGLSSSYPGALYSINATTGTATKLTDITGHTSLTGLEYLNGNLYATDVMPTGGGFTFGSIDPDTGVYTVINNQNGSANWHGLAGDPASGLLYTVDINNSDKLTSIDPVANVITPIGNGSSDIDGRGMAYDPVHHILYGTGVSSLYTFNTTTGAATLIGPMGIATGLIGLAYDPVAGILYGNSGDTHALYSINASTGLASLIGSNGTSTEIDGLAWVGSIQPPPNPIPEPASILLFGTGLGLLGLAAWKRR